MFTFPVAHWGPYLFDRIKTPVVAYSFRKLKSGMTLCCRVRRSSDNAQTDVLLEESGQITTSSLVSAGGTLSTWASTNTIYATKWYDQTGNGYDALHGTTSAQPILMDSGSLKLMPSSSIVAMDSTAGAKMLYAAITFPVTGDVSFEAFVVESMNVGSSGRTGLALSSITPRTYVGDRRLIQTVAEEFVDPTVRLFGGNTTYSDTPTGGNRVSVTHYNGGGVPVGARRSGTALTTQSNSNVSPYLNVQSDSAFTVCGAGSSTGYTGAPSAESKGYVSECFWYLSDESTDRVAIEAELEEFYGL